MKYLFLLALILLTACAAAVQPLSTPTATPRLQLIEFYSPM